MDTGIKPDTAVNPMQKVCRNAFDNIKILSCERFGAHSSIWNFERHSHDFYEFLYFIDGKARIEAGKNMDISMFNLVIYPPGSIMKKNWM